MDFKEVEKIVGHYQSNLFKNSNSYSVGVLKSHFKGAGLQFKDHQAYTHGDDIRFIDWKLLAKKQTPYIKTFEEERNVEIIIIVDCGMSMQHGYKGVSKLQACIEICVLMYLLADLSNDKVNVVLIGEKIINLPKESGKKGITQLIMSLERNNIIDENGKIKIGINQKSNIKDDEIYKNILKSLSKKKELVILSDFNNFLDFKQLKSFLKVSSLHCFRIIGPLDENDSIKFSLFGLIRDNKTKKLKKVNLLQNSIKSIDRDEIEKILGRNIKTLNVKDRYLENFVRDMI